MSQLADLQFGIWMGGGGAAAHLIGWDSTTTGSVPVPFPVWSHSRKPYRPSSGVPSQLWPWKSMKLSTGETEAATSQIPNVRWMAWLSCLSETVFGPQQLDTVGAGTVVSGCHVFRGFRTALFGNDVQCEVSQLLLPAFGKCPRPNSWSLCPP